LLSESRLLQAFEFCRATTAVRGRILFNGPSVKNGVVDNSSSAFNSLVVSGLFWPR